EPLRLGLGLGNAPREFGIALLGFGGAGLPVVPLLAGRVGALLVGADRAGVGRGLGADLGQRRLGALGGRAQRGDSSLGRGGVGERGGDALGFGERLLRVGEIGGGERGTLAEPGPAQLQPLDLDRDIVLLAPGLADRGARLRLGAARFIGGIAGRLHFGQRGRGGALGLLERRGGGGKRGF